MKQFFIKSIILSCCFFSTNVAKAQDDYPYISMSEITQLSHGQKADIYQKISNLSEYEKNIFNDFYTQQYIKKFPNSKEKQDWAKSANKTDDIFQKVTTVLDLNHKPEDFIHLIDKEQLRKSYENSEDETKSEQPKKTLPQKKVPLKEETVQVHEEDSTTKHVFMRRRFTTK